MAEINKSDLITDEALQAPLLLNSYFENLIRTIERLQATTKQSEAIAMAAKTTGELKVETEQLTQAQVELEKIQKQISTAQAKNTTEYANEKKVLNELNQSIKDKTTLGDKDTQSINAQNASIKVLGAALDKNRKLYSDLAGEQARNTRYGLELLKVIQAQDKEFKALNDTIGKSSVHVGDYKGQLKDLLDKVGGGGVTNVVNNVKQVFTEISNFAASAVNEVSSVSGAALITFGALAIGVAGAIVGAYYGLRKSIDLYLNDTAEGQEKLTEITNKYEATLAIVQNTLKEIGGSIIEVLFPRIEVQVAMLEKVRTFYAGLPAIFGKAYAIPIIDAYIGKLKEAEKLTEEENELRKRQIELTVEGAALSLEKDKQMFEARDKITHTDLQRLEAVRKSREAGKELREKTLADLALETQILKDQLKRKYDGITADTKALDLLKDANALRKISFADIQHLAALEAREMEIHDEAFKGARRRQALEYGIIEEIVKRERSKNKAIADGDRELAIVREQSVIDTNNRIIGNQNYSLDEQLKAAMDNGVAILNIQDKNKEKEIVTAKEAAFARVEISKESAKAIFESESLAPLEQIRQFILAKNKAVEADKGYRAELFAIDEKYRELNIKTEIEHGNKTAAVVANNYQHFIDVRKRVSEKDAQDALRELDARLETENLTYKQYEIQRAAILKAQKVRDLQITKDERTQELQELKKLLDARIDLTNEEAALLVSVNKELNATLLAQDEMGVTLRIEAKRREKDAIKQLIQEVFTSAVQTGDNIFAAQQQNIQASIDAISAQKDKEIELAGDNADAKVAIEKDYQKKIEEEKKKLKESQRKQAIYDKALAALNILVNTAQAVIGALAPPPVGLGPVLGLPLSFAIGAIGALQEVAVLSKPIPQYWKGGISEGGPAFVGERGMELIRTGDSFSISPSTPTLVNLQKGAEVIPHEETVKLLAMTSMGEQAILTQENNLLQSEIKTLQKVFAHHGKEIVSAVRKGNGNLYKQGSLVYKSEQQNDGSRKLVRLKSLSE